MENKCRRAAWRYEEFRCGRPTGKFNRISAGGPLGSMKSLEVAGLREKFNRTSAGGPTLKLKASVKDRPAFWLRIRHFGWGIYNIIVIKPWGFCGYCGQDWATRL